GSNIKALVAAVLHRTSEKINLTLRVVDENDKEMPARVSIKGEDGRFYGPDGALWFADDAYDRSKDSFEHNYFYTSGHESMTLPVSRFSVEVAAGYDRPFNRKLGVAFTSGPNVLMQLGFNPKIKLGDDSGSWVSGDLHVHMNYGGTYKNELSDLARMAKAEGLSVINELTVN